LRILIAFLVVILFLLSAAYGLWVVSQEPHLDVQVGQNAEGQFVLTKVVPGSLGWDLGLRPGMRVLAVNGSPPEAARDPIDSVAVQSPDTGGIILAEARSLACCHGPQSILPFAITGVLFLAVGVTAYLSSTQALTASLFLAFCFFASLVLVFAPGGGNGFLWPRIATFQVGLLLAGTLISLLLNFPARLSLPWTKGRAYVPVASGLIFVAPVLIAQPLTFWLVPDVYAGVIRPLWYYQIAALLSFSGLAMLRHWLAAPTELAREQTRIIALGTVLALIPLVFLTILPTGLTGRYLVPPSVTVPLLSLMPISFAVAFMRYQVMGIRRLVHRSAIYALSWAAVLGVIGLFIQMVDRLTGLAQWGAAGVVAIVLGVAAGVVAFPHLERVAKQLVDRLLYQDFYDYEEAMQRLLREVAQCHSLRELGATITGRLRHLLNLDYAAFLVFSRASALEAVAVSYRHDTSGPQPLPEIWSALVSLPEAGPGTQVLRREGTEPALAVPLLATGRVLGWLLLGPKPTGELPPASDQQFLQAVATAVAPTVENLLLLDELAEKVAALEETTSLLERSREELRLLNQRLVEAQEQERTRLAHDLHDGPLQRVLMLIRECDTAGQGEGFRQRLKQLAAELRSVSTRLRPPMLDDLGLGPALEWLAGEVSALSGGGTRISVRIPDEEIRLAPEAETALFRIAQEALNNALKHAQAQNIHLSLAQEGEEVVLKVEDNGQGFDPQRVSSQLTDPHLGLLGMKERARAVGAELTIASRPGEGTTVRVALPAPHRSTTETEGSLSDAKRG